MKAIISGAAIAILLAIFLLVEYGWRQSALLLVGLSAGIVLYHAAFGFTSAWRVFVVKREGQGLRAQMVMLGLTVLLLVPLIALGELNGQPVRGSVAPISLSIVFGAFIFGIGMQLGGGCASGTLYTAGGGNSRMVITLIAFISGSVLGAMHWSIWQEVPALPPTSLLQLFGPIPAIVVSLLLFSSIWLLIKKFEVIRDESNNESNAGSWITGPWPLIAGAVGLAMIQLSTFLLAGRPWGVTSAFTLWGAKLLIFAGGSVEGMAYFQRPSVASALENSIFNDVTSVMNIGIILGAMIAAALAGKFSPTYRISWKSFAAAVIGGLLLGYGARIAYGCNIGAFYSGVSSTSLHGWLWFIAAFAGSSFAVRLRPFFHLQN